jgi:hypothetical protein
MPILVGERFSMRILVGERPFPRIFDTSGRFQGVHQDTRALPAQLFALLGYLARTFDHFCIPSCTRGCPKDGGKPPINNNVENHQEMESCYVMFTVTSKLDRHLQ